MTEDEALAALRGDDPTHAARAAAALWEMWHRSGDPRVDSVLRQGIEAMQRDRSFASREGFEVGSERVTQP